jgi:hypothetical protein
MIAETDILWNGHLYAAGTTIPAREKKLIASLEATQQEEPAKTEEEPTIKPKGK